MFKLTITYKFEEPKIKQEEIFNEMLTQVGKFYKSKVVEKLNKKTTSQGTVMTPIATGTIKYRDKMGYSGIEPLKMTGKLEKSISYKVNNKAGRVTIISDFDGGPIMNLKTGKLHDKKPNKDLPFTLAYGTKDGHIPARDFINLTKQEQESLNILIGYYLKMYTTGMILDILKSYSKGGKK